MNQESVKVVSRAPRSDWSAGILPAGFCQKTRCSRLEAGAPSVVDAERPRSDWMRVRLVLVCLGLLACLPGCGTLKGDFNTHRDPNYAGKLERLLIVYYNEDDAAKQLGSKFTDTFLARVTEALGRRNVPVHVARPMQGALDEQGVVRLAAARFRPQQVMQFSLSRIVTQTGATRSTGGSVPQFVNNQSVTFRFSLSQVGTERYIWRGDLRYSVIPEGTTVADQLVEQLVTERFLSAAD